MPSNFPIGTLLLFPVLVVLLSLVWAATSANAESPFNPTLVQSIRDASSSTELKAAVGALPRSAAYFTTEIRDLVLQKQKLVADTQSADAVVSYFREFASNSETRDLLRTAGIRDLIINVLAPKISAGDPTQNLGEIICDVTYQQKPAAELYSNRKSFSAILDSFPRATTAGASQWIAASITNICNEIPEANKILNDLPVVEAFSAIIPRATSDDSVRCISNSVAAILSDNEPAQKLFGTSTFLEKFKTMEKYTTSDEAKTPFTKMIDTLQYPALLHSLRRSSTTIEFKATVNVLPRSLIFFTAEIRDAILQQQNLVADTQSADAVISFLREFASNSAKRELLRTAEIRDLVINVLAPKISGGEPVKNLGEIVCDLTYENKVAAQLFSNQKSLSTILSCFNRATTAGSAQWIASSITNICNESPEAESILNNLPVVEAYSAIIPRATSDDSVRCISNFIAVFLNENEPAQKLFGTSTFMELVKTMEKYATSDDAKTPFKNVVDTLQKIIDDRLASEQL